MLHSNTRWKRAWDISVAVLALGIGIFIPLYAVFPFASGPLIVLSAVVALVFFLDAGFEIALARRGADAPGAADVAAHEAVHLRAPTAVVAAVIAAFPSLVLAATGVLPGGAFRLLLALPMFKLGKLNRTMRRVGEAVMNPAVVRLVLLVFWILMAGHIIACGWILVSGNPAGLGASELYITAYYWTMTTLTTIGYGDITPSGQAQMLFVIPIQLFGAAMYGLIIGSIAGLLANIDVAKRRYREKMEQINAFLRYRNIPDNLKRKINSYYAYLWETRKGYEETEFLHDLPAALKESVALHLNKEIIERVPLFEQANENLIRDIILAMEPVVFTPNDYIVRAGEIGRDMYFISKGSVAVLSADETVTYATLTAGQFFGEISLLLSTPRTATIRALEFCDLYQLNKDQFDHVLEHYPEFRGSIQELAEERRNRVEALQKQENSP